MFCFEFSQTIIDCFLKATQKLGIAVGQRYIDFQEKKRKLWKIETQTENYLLKS
jgi:hypothetical protein